MDSVALLANEELSDDDYSDRFPANRPQAALESLDINLPSSSTLEFIQEDTLCSSLREKSGRFSKISEDQTTENYVRTFDGFFKEMMGKVKSLKNSPALDNQNRNGVVDIDEQKLFKHLKETPEVKEKLNNIRRLDEEIKNVIDLYKVEKAERIKTQLEMCEEMEKDDTLPDRETTAFLNFCNFDLSEAGDEVPEKESASKISTPAGPNQFIKKNIELAREGLLANLSLTDEEKSKIEDLLCEEDEERISLSEERSDNSNYLASNAYFFTVDETSRIRDIDSELEKFAKDEKMNEKNEQSNQDYENMTDFLLEQSIKRLEKKLNDLHDKEKEDVRGPYLDADGDEQNGDVLE